MSTPRNLRVLLAYDGARFFGWQRQAGFLSVQEALEEAIDDLTGEPATVYGSGRTDTGVHALGQVASFQLS
ncbi:MAG: tRNA pseudouridine(38-40) synthase TruA, partial [Planctomycetota bacterium]|nr:tRNA pseudouridine(38-40) synthase TruA [Planctomycetota bacterium]